MHTMAAATSEIGTLVFFWPFPFDGVPSVQSVSQRSLPSQASHTTLRLTTAAGRHSPSPFLPLEVEVWGGREAEGGKEG